MDDYKLTEIGSNGRTASRTNSGTPGSNAELLLSGTAGWKIAYEDLKILMPPLGRGSFGMYHRLCSHLTIT